MINTYKEPIIKKIDGNRWESKWLYFRLIGHKPKTTVWEVVNKSNFKLGEISWWSGWRQYVFDTMPTEMMFDDGCLISISTFLTWLNEEQRGAMK